MNQMTFPNYLKEYLRFVSGSQTLSVCKLFNKSKRNSRIIDPLILYCVFNDKVETFKKITSKFNDILDKLSPDDFCFDEFIEYSFNKIYDSYSHRVKKFIYDLDTKEMMRNNILELKKEKNVSTYRLYTDLHLNPGNVNAFIKKHELNKLSISNVQRIVLFLYNK